MGDEKKEGPDSNIKEYIINGRKNGFSDTVIVENLKKTNWPDDIIESAMKEADKEVPPVSKEEKPEEPGKEKKEEETNEEKKEESEEKEEPKEETPEKEAQKEEKLGSDLLTKPPEGIFPEKKEAEAVGSVKKKFSLLAVLALLLSPIPFVGLGMAMFAIDNIRKNHKRGTILAVLALIINVIVILAIIWFMYQIFTLEPNNLAGFAKYINDMFNIV